MSTTTAGGPVPTRIRPIDELFTGAVTGLWATSYSIDLSLFNEFLLARLGEPPLNIAALVDHRRLAAGLARIPAERADTLAAVNRNWLLRGVHAAAAFHPKSYLAVTASRAKLLVGSGNLTADGLNDGHEVFTAFPSHTEVGAAAIAAWRSWMLRLVTQVGDTALAGRFQELEPHLPPAPTSTSATPSPLLHNLDTPIADQLTATVTTADVEVEELWLTAPFYDQGAVAVGALLHLLAPRRITLFVHPSTEVDGRRLTARLTESGAQITVMQYAPDTFVHAKLIAVIAGSRAWLLSGSANLSRAALTLTPHTGGNTELAVLTPLDPDEARTLFISDDITTVERGLDALACLTHRDDPDPDLPPVRLVTAAARGDGRIEIRTEPPAGDDWRLDDLTDRQPLTAVGDGRALTAGPLAGRLVQLVAADGAILSNRAVVDDPDALAAVLTASTARPGGDRPAELTSEDLGTTLGRELQWLHRNLVMDVGERTAPTAGESTGGTTSEGDSDDDLWGRLEREQLTRDPRAGTYARMWADDPLGHTEPIIQLLDDLRARTPSEPLVHTGSLLALLLERTAVTADLETPPRVWSTSAKIRVRARNLLQRWAAAQNDPRLLWIDPLAPAKNFATVTGTLAHLRLVAALHPGQVELTTDDLETLWQQWLRPIAGTGQRDGWLDALDDAERSRVRERMPGWLGEAAAALCWIAARPGPGYRDRVISLQPVLNAALDHGLLDPTETTARYLSAITRENLTRDKIDNDLLNAIEFVDDQLWCTRTAGELRLDELELESLPGAKGVQTRVGVRGIEDPLLDPRLPRLAVAVRRYRRCDTVIVHGLGADWRISLSIGETIAYLPERNNKGDILESGQPLSSAALEGLEAVGGALASLMPPDAQPVR